jgi:photosystem II stability/assembly factor-like uncharacterized protein
MIMKKVILLLLLVMTGIRALPQAGWLPQNPGTGFNLHDVYFTDSLHGYIVGLFGDTILKTSDHGSSWNKIIKTEVSPLYSVMFTDDNHGFASGHLLGKFARTTDAGNTWTISTISTRRYYDTFFADSLLGWVVGENASIQKSVDGGQTWGEVYSATALDQLNSIHFPSPPKGWAV